MKRRFLLSFAVFVALSAELLSAQGGGGAASAVTQLVRDSNASANGLILSMMSEGNLTQSLEIARALGERRDPYIGNILAGIASGAHGKDGYLAELRLRVLLMGFFTGGDFLRGRVESARLAPNAAEVKSLVLRLPDFEDPVLKAELLGLAIEAAPREAAKLAAGEGVYLHALLRSGGGLLAPERREEALAYLGLVGRLKDPVLIEQTIGLIAASRDPEFVRRARAVSGG